MKSGAGENIVIAAFLGTQALGDYVMQSLVAASVARALPGGKLVVIYRDDRPYKSLVNSFNPYIATTVKAGADPNSVIPLDWFDGELDGPGRPFGQAWYEAGFHAPDIILTPSMMTMNHCQGPPPRFAFPGELKGPLGTLLARKGLDENRWFACLHMREDGYRWRMGSDKDRSVDPKTYIPMITDIIENQGGQVVRLGHPSMTPLPEIDGVIDLCFEENNFLEQAFALSRARYFIGCDTGPTQLACAFKTPTASTNALGLGVWNDGDVLLLKALIDQHGTALDLNTMGDILPLLGNERPIDLEIRDNSPERLLDVARHMFDATADCPAWREESADPPYEPPGDIALPLPKTGLTDMADLTIWG